MERLWSPPTRGLADGEALTAVYRMLAVGSVAALAATILEVARTESMPWLLVCATCLPALPLIVLQRRPTDSPRLLAPSLALGTAAISLTVAYEPFIEITAACVVLYAAIAMAALCFLPPRALAVLALWMSACYGTSLAATHTFTVAHWAGALTAIWSVSLFPLASRLRTNILIGYLRDTAIRDPLTALLNRRGFDEAIGDAIADARHGDWDLSLLIGEVDYFKALNDDHGHHVGDEVLMEVAAILMAFSPDDATLARIDGHEFAAIVEGHSCADALGLAEALRREVQDSFESRDITVTISFGVATLGMHGNSPEELHRAADHALFAAQELGRNRSVSYSDEVLSIINTANIRRDENSRTHLATLLTLVEALDLRDVSTSNHSHTVAEYAEWMAQELGLEPALVERIRIAGLMHDIGKIGIPDSVLLKPGKLDDDEWALMRQHPEIGARLLNHRDYEDVRSWVLAHHERPDGRGYPFGMSTEIPLGARILSVADAYEAMTADRVYRAALGHHVARRELIDCAGTQFDPVVVEAFLRVLNREGLGTDSHHGDDIRDAA